MSTRRNTQPCRVCSCTPESPCKPPCHRVAPGFCSRCHDVLVTMLNWDQTAYRPNVVALIREFVDSAELIGYRRSASLAKGGGAL